MPYGACQDAGRRAARQQVHEPSQTLDGGGGSGRVPARMLSIYQQAHVVGVDPSTEMIKNAITASAIHSARFTSAMAEQLPFTDAAFDLVVVTLSLSHWRNKAAGLAEISRVMAPDTTLVVADVLPARPARPITVRAQRRKQELSHGLVPLITATGLRITHVQPILSVSLVADATLIAAKKHAAGPGPRPSPSRTCRPACGGS